MTNIVFSFDTEDFVNPGGADAIKKLIEIMDEEGVTGCFNTVGRLALALEKWGRQDVIEKMKHHEIETHTRNHSVHPTNCEYTDIPEYAPGEKEFLRIEQDGVDILKRVFDLDEVTIACPPGLDTSYVSHYGFAKMGMKIYTGSFVVDRPHNRPVSYANSYSLNYHDYGLEDFLPTADDRKLREVLDESAEYDVMVLWNHPAMILYDDFWDEMNYKGVNTPEEEWLPGRPLPQEKVDKFYENFRKLIRLIKADPRFRITTYKTLAKEYETTREIRLADIPFIKSQLDEAFFPVTFPDSYCLTDILYACRDFLLGETVHPCGWVFGFLDKPKAIDRPVTVSRAGMEASAKTLSDKDFLPLSVTVDGQELGTADWLRAALELLVSGADRVTVEPGEWQIDLEKHFPRLAHTCYKGTWVFSEDLQDTYLSDRLRLQSWTIRLPAGTYRFVY